MLLHVDLCGPVSPSTLAGNSYFMLIVDDHSRMMWVYIMKAKSQTFLELRKFINWVENSSGHRVKTIRSDRGGEFLSNELVNLCEERGIERQLTVPYTPQQNGIVERRNRTVMEMARSMLKSMKVPGELWG